MKVISESRYLCWLTLSDDNINTILEFDGRCNYVKRMLKVDENLSR